MTRGGHIYDYFLKRLLRDHEAMRPTNIETRCVQTVDPCLRELAGRCCRLHGGPKSDSSFTLAIKRTCFSHSAQCRVLSWLRLCEYSLYHSSAVERRGAVLAFSPSAFDSKLLKTSRLFFLDPLFCWPSPHIACPFTWTLIQLSIIHRNKSRKLFQEQDTVAPSFQRDIHRRCFLATGRRFTDGNA